MLVPGRAMRDHGFAARGSRSDRRTGPAGWRDGDENAYRRSPPQRPASAAASRTMASAAAPTLAGRASTMTSL